MQGPLTQEQKLLHFLRRTSFGPTSEEMQKLTRIGVARYLDEQLAPDKISDGFIEEKLSQLKTMRLSSRELIELYPPPRAVQNLGMAPQAMQGPQQVTFELQLARLLRAVYSRRQLYEVMVDFWTNHFNIFAGKGADRWLTTAYDRDTIRPHALGNFRDLLLATAQSPAMLFYLDNWLSVSPDAPVARRQPNNPRRGINENYARELMELHTLGVDGGYTQKDVLEVARCFTGWTVVRPRQQGEFRFEPRLHDDGPKNVLGTRIDAGGGMEDGIKVTDLLARHPSTAKFIAAKLARRFVADDPPASLVSRAAETFRRSDGDIRAVVRVIIEAPEFFSAETYKAKVKKPLEFVASSLRLTQAETRMSRQLVRYLGRMGEPLFLAQPPTGYPDFGNSWISPDMLLTRMNFAADLAANRLEGAHVPIDALGNARDLVSLIAPEGLSAATRAALVETEDKDTLALLLAAPEFQRR
jgi:uncharacterized protein (DUF1800 family)